MSETEARAADDATSGTGSSGSTFRPTGSGKHRAPVEPVGPTSASTPTPMPARSDDQVRAPEAGSTPSSWSHDDDTRVIPQYTGVDEHDDVDEPDTGDVEEGPEQGSDQRDDQREDQREDQQPEREPSWWHRSHPTFAGLVGFFTGVLYVIVVPGVYAALLSWLVSEKEAQSLFPLIAVALLVPIVLLVPRKTRRFAQFMLLGVVSTAVVVAVTAALVFWVLVKTSG